jgi:branched-chain amino acid transport system substrate-binding protein
MARIKEQNAAGGVDGRQLVLVSRDDQSTPAQNAIASQQLVSQNVFGVENFSSFAFGGARFLSQKRIPVAGFAVDGPEWAQQPNTNMFSYSAPTTTPFNGINYTYDYGGKFLKSVGVTKLASLSYGISPSAITAAKGLIAAAKSAGITDCYDNFSVPFGAVDFTAAVLAVKSKGCDGTSAPFVEASDVALSGALKQGGVSGPQLFYTGYSNDVLDNPAARASLQDAYITTQINFTTPNAAVAHMLDEFKKYVPTYKGGIPDLGLYGSYLATDLMIKGLQVAGMNPTRESFISALRNVSDYTANGILPSPTSFTNFGTKAMLPTSACSYFVQLKGNQYVVTNGGKAICGNLIPIQ